MKCLDYSLILHFTLGTETESLHRHFGCPWDTMTLQSTSPVLADNSEDMMPLFIAPSIPQTFLLD